MSLLRPSGLHSAEVHQYSDEALMRLVQSGRHDALTVLFDRYHRLVYSVAFRIVRDQGEAEEVVQTVFLDVFRAAGKFDPARSNPKVWILQYAYHRSFNRRRNLVANHFYHWEELQAVIESGFDRAISSDPPETARFAEQMLERLKPRQRVVVEMTYYEGLTAEEIAGRLNESVHVIRHDLQRGLAALRSIFKKSENDGK
jgi:RNA polymerase sigma-70 factor (ECF subfamily)